MKKMKNRAVDMKTIFLIAGNDEENKQKCEKVLMRMHGHRNLVSVKSLSEMQIAMKHKHNILYVLDQSVKALSDDLFNHIPSQYNIKGYVVGDDHIPLLNDSRFIKWPSSLQIVIKK